MPWRLRRKTEALVSVKFLDRRAGAVDGATEGEIMNHRKLQSPHIARLKEVRTAYRASLVAPAASRSQAFNDVQMFLLQRAVG